MQLTPSCDPLLESMDAEYNGQYITIDNENLIEVEQLDPEASDIVGFSTFTAKCAFERNYI